MQFGKGGLKNSGRDSMLSQSSNLSMRDSAHGITIEKRPSRTRSEMLDAIRANRQGSNTNLNVISIVNTTSFNVTPGSMGGMGTAGHHRRHSLGEADVITVPRRISKVMGFNKLEFNPMALDQERSGPLLELGVEKKKEERSQKQQAQEEAHRRGTCILEDNVLGRGGGVGVGDGSMHDQSIKALDGDDDDIIINTTNHNNRQSQPLTSDTPPAVDSSHGPASFAPKQGSSQPPMPQIHTVAKLEVSGDDMIVRFFVFLKNVEE